MNRIYGILFYPKKGERDYKEGEKNSPEAIGWIGHSFTSFLGLKGIKWFEGNKDSSRTKIVATRAK
jgi:hypothetical protein